MANRNLEVGLKISADVKEIKGAFGELNRSIKRSILAGKQASLESTDNFRRIEKQIRRTGKSASSMARQIKSAFAAVGGALLLRNVTQTALEFDKFNRTLRFVAGSAAGARREMEFLEKLANTLGLNLATATESYASFAAAARGTAIEGDATRQIFLAVSEASTVMGLSADDTRGVMLALSQIISKGKVSAEELRQQLGERLPGAFQIAARSMGVTTTELDKMLSSGSLLSEVFLPKFAEEMHRTFGPSVVNSITSTQAKMNRFQNTVTQLQLAFADSGFLESFTESLEELSTALSDPSMREGLKALGSFIGDSIKFVVQHHREIISVFSALATFSLLTSIGLDKVKIKGAAAGRVIAPLTAILAGLATWVGLAKDNTDALGDSLNDLGGDSNGGALTIDVTRDSVSLLTEEAEKSLQAFEDVKKILADYNEELANGVEIGSISAAQAQARLAIRARELGLSLPVERMRELARTLETAGRNDLAQALRTALSELDRLSQSASTGLVDGIKEGARSYSESVNNLAQQASTAVENAFSGMEDALVEFVTKGKLSFKSLVDSIKADIARIAIQQNVTAPLAQAFSGFTASAKGNAFSGGQLLAFASGGAFTNSVVTGATMFPLGLMGEAGPEAILPLKRVAGGNLGVSAEGIRPKVDVHIHEDRTRAGEVEDREEGGVSVIDVFVDQVRGELIHDIGRSGDFSKALETQYGLDRASGRRR